MHSTAESGRRHYFISICYNISKSKSEKQEERRQLAIGTKAKIYYSFVLVSVLIALIVWGLYPLLFGNRGVPTYNYRQGL